jgi:hypothetical protein
MLPVRPFPRIWPPPTTMPGATTALPPPRRQGGDAFTARSGQIPGGFGDRVTMTNPPILELG